jgi:hypothetical protein
VGQRGLRDAGTAAHRVEEAIRRIDAVEVLRYFAAEEAAGDGMRWVATQTGGASGVVNGDEDPAGVGAVEGTYGVDGPWGHRNRVQGTGYREQGAGNRDY